jgi:hypothetical protein
MLSVRDDVQNRVLNVKNSIHAKVDQVGSHIENIPVEPSAAPSQPGYDELE